MLIALPAFPAIRPKLLVSPKMAQTLARHSDISLTMKIYTHVDQEEQIEAINLLPSLEPDNETEKE